MEREVGTMGCSCFYQGGDIYKVMIWDNPTDQNSKEGKGSRRESSVNHASTVQKCHESLGLFLLVTLDTCPGLVSTQQIEMKIHFLWKPFSKLLSTINKNHYPSIFQVYVSAGAHGKLGTCAPSNKGIHSSSSPHFCNAGMNVQCW